MPYWNLSDVRELKHLPRFSERSCRTERHLPFLFSLSPIKGGNDVCDIYSFQEYLNFVNLVISASLCGTRDALSILLSYRKHVRTAAQFIREKKIKIHVSIILNFTYNLFSLMTQPKILETLVVSSPLEDISSRYISARVIHY